MYTEGRKNQTFFQYQAKKPFRYLLFGERRPDRGKSLAELVKTIISQSLE